MPVFDSKPERNNNPPRRENNSSNRKKEGGTEENPMELRMKAIQRVFRSRGMDFDSFFKKNETEPENKALESEADQVADNVVAKKQGNESNPNNIKPQNHLVIQRQTEKGGDKGGGKPESKQGKDLIVELPDFREMLNVEGRGTVYLGRSFLVYADTSKPLCVENASPSIDPHLRYHREFKVVTEDGRTIYLMIQGRTASAESKSASINDQGQSSFAYRLIVERSDGKQVWKENRFDEYTDNSSIFQIISGIQEINPILFLPRRPDELFLNTIISEADKMLPGFPKKESAPEKGWGADDYEGGIGNSYASDESKNAPFIDQSNRKEIGKDHESQKPWGEMTEPERRAEAWMVFQEEFSWENVAKIVAAGVALVALIASLPEGSAIAAAATAGMAQLATLYGIYTLIAPALEGASPQIRDWIKGGVLVLGGITIVVAAVASSEFSVSAGVATGLLLGMIYVVTEVMSSVSDFSDATAAPSREKMEELAKSSAHEAENAIADGILTVLPVKQLKRILERTGQVKQSAPAEEALPLDSENFKRKSPNAIEEADEISKAKESQAATKAPNSGFSGDEIYQKQKSVVEDVLNGEIELSNTARKGNFGEMRVDVDMQEHGWTAMHDRITNIDAPTIHGLDHVFMHKGPPPVTIIAESKFQYGRLAVLVNGTKQMSDRWIRSRLISVLGEAEARRILRVGYKSVLAKISADGKITYRLLDKSGKTIGKFSPNDI